MAWIDYKEAFDSVPHSWIIDSLKTYKVHPTIVGFLERAMREWKTEMHIYHSAECIKTGRILIKRGIFQANFFSPLLFCVALIQSLNHDEKYKYLGINKIGGIDFKNIKVKTEKEYLHRLRLIFGTELSAQNKVKAINSFSGLVPQCTFRILNWRCLEIKQFERTTRKMLTSYKFHYQKADDERLYIPRCSGAHRLTELEDVYKKTNLGLYDYIRHEPDKFIKLISNHEKSKAKYSLVKEGEKVREKYLSSEPGDNKHATRPG